MEMPKVLPNDDGIRPAGKPDECFYCSQKINTSHLRDCVALKKRIRARYTFEVEIEIPYHWSPEDFESHRNLSSWCADNALHDLQEYHDRVDIDGHTCVFCPGFEARFLEEVEPGPYATSAIPQPQDKEVKP